MAQLPAIAVRPGASVAIDTGRIVVPGCWSARLLELVGPPAVAVAPYAVPAMTVRALSGALLARSRTERDLWFRQRLVKAFKCRGSVEHGRGSSRFGGCRTDQRVRSGQRVHEQGFRAHGGLSSGAGGLDQPTREVRDVTAYLAGRESPAAGLYLHVGGARPDDREAVVNLELHDVGDGTCLVLSQGAFLTSRRPALHRLGWTDSLERFRAAVSGTRDSPRHRARRPPVEKVAKESEWGTPQPDVRIADQTCQIRVCFRDSGHLWRGVH